MNTPARSTMGRDLVSAYAASGAKVASWAAVSAMIYQCTGSAALGLLALIRSTIGLLNYTTLGLGPAMIHNLAAAMGEKNETDPKRPSPTSSVYANGLAIAIVCCVVGVALVWIYSTQFQNLYTIDPELQSDIADIVFMMGVGLLLRLCSDASGALLQLKGLLWLDNVFIILSESLWVYLAFSDFRSYGWGYRSDGLDIVAHGFLYSSIALFVLRFFASGFADAFRGMRPSLLRASVFGTLLKYGSLITLAQLADFLYAPTDFILINNLIDTKAAGVYTPAVQIDAALLLLVTGLASVLLPKAAIAHAQNDRSLLGKYYRRGTIASLVTLLVAGAGVWIASPMIFKIWFKDPMTATQAILPLVLVHTIVGGSSAVGRSILLAMGKVKPFTISVLIAGVSNVVLSFVFVKFFGMGLRGIVLGTIIAVVGRCAIWMPWYVMKTLRGPVDREQAIESETILTQP